ncbi:MAG: folate-binding protein YgfZ [Burkholderiales bacterium]|nr:folate-binding protein YgfZ [Burkholderiales bacterium]
MNPDWLIFLTNHNAHIEQNRVLHFGQPAAELTQAESGPLLIDLSHLGLIRFSGEDAQDFLQGQLSCDIRAITPEKASYGGYCTPKGRLLCSFLIWQDASDHSYLMQLPAELVESIAKRLRMFMLRSKVLIQDNSGHFIRIGIAGQNAQAWLQETLPDAPITAAPMTVTSIPDGQIICHSANRFEILTIPAQAPSLWEQLSKQVRCAGAPIWDWLEIGEGIPVIFKATQEQFIPQMINLDSIDGVNFRKGCYPGQEIVARTQYLGKVKRRMYRAHLDTDSHMEVSAGDSLFSADTGDQACGMIVNAAPSPAGGVDVLAVIQTSSAETGPVHWKTPDGLQLAIQPLPYLAT